MLNCEIAEELNNNNLSNRERQRIYNNLIQQLISLLRSVGVNINNAKVELISEKDACQRKLVDCDEVKSTKALYKDYKVYVIKERNVCVQNLLHELLHSLQNQQWGSVYDLIKEGLVEFISAYVLYENKDHEFKIDGINIKLYQCFRCTVNRRFTPCSISERLGYSNGYSLWATIYKRYKLTLNDFLDILTNFKSEDHNVQLLMDDIRGANKIEDPCDILADEQLKRECKDIETFFEYNVFY
ncbi:MAG: hypothetical protein OWQ54_00410 [Sulfolobaceae archaeon]|nr:hypothetical protein [Sulfolobaceae archaeon]